MQSFQKKALSAAVSIAMNERKSKITNENIVTKNQVQISNDGDYLSPVEVKQYLAQSLFEGGVDKKFASKIMTEDGFCSVEGELIDFKRDYPTDRTGLAKLIKHIGAFHNLYGGYLVYGVEEDKENNVFRPIHSEESNLIDAKQLRDLTRDYFDVTVDVAAQNCEVEFLGETLYVSVLFIPKRLTEYPVSFKKRGPQLADSNKFLFEVDGVPLREADNTTLADKLRHWHKLYSDRRLPDFRSTEIVHTSYSTYHDLPDRHSIYSEFVGRDQYIAELYKWFSDQFSCVRVIAGEGGLGKTSVAYQFASEISTNKSFKYDAVHWLTAKAVQFRALSNTFEDAGITHFSSAQELFKAIAINLAATEEEIDDLSSNSPVRTLRKLLSVHKVFIVCDDLDSLGINDQKWVVEVLQQLGGLGSRFLLTTRKNVTASSFTAIELQGFPLQEYIAYLKIWVDRFKLNEFSEKQIEKLHDTSRGSPMYTDSILRLVRSGEGLNEAIKKWNGRLGAEVINAALARETMQVSNESKRTLVAIAALGECSLVELRTATGYAAQTLMDTLNELQALYLVSQPPLAGEPRFSMPSTTRLLVESNGYELIPDYNSFRSKLLSERYKQKNVQVDLVHIGAAINQANAFLKQRQPEDALRTAEEVNRKYAGKNKDLLFMEGRALLAMNPPRNTEASKRFNLAYNCDQRKALFFSLWFETEVATERFESAVEVASRAIDASSGNRTEWRIRRAEARLQLASKNIATDEPLGLSQLEQVANDLKIPASEIADCVYKDYWKELVATCNDTLLKHTLRLSITAPDVVRVIDQLLEFIKRGDERIEKYLELDSQLIRLRSLFQSQAPDFTDAQLQLLSIQTNKTRSAFKSAPGLFRTFPVFRRAQERIEHEARNFG